MIRDAGLYDSISQAYAALDSNKAVGVMGDKRVYGYMIVLRGKDKAVDYRRWCDPISSSTTQLSQHDSNTCFGPVCAGVAR